MTDHPLIRAKQAVDAVTAKYGSKQADWRTGVTCLHMIRFHLRALGHRPERLPRLRSLIAAKRALKERGWETLADVLDAQPGLMRITPAMARLGDIAVAPSADGIGAGHIFVGVSRDGRANFLGWHDTDTERQVHGMQVIKFALNECTGVWRP